MSLSLYTDHHVRSAIVKGLRRRGIDILTAQEDGRADHADEAILARVCELNRIIFTQDADFLAIAHRWQRAGHHFPGVIYAHQLHATVGRIVADLQLILEASACDEISDTVVFLPL